jgi:hypothetical protein
MEMVVLHQRLPLLRLSWASTGEQADLGMSFSPSMVGRGFQRRKALTGASNMDRYHHKGVIAHHCDTPTCRNRQRMVRNGNGSSTVLQTRVSMC